MRSLLLGLLLACSAPARAQLIPRDDDPHPPKEVPSSVRIPPPSAPWPARLIMSPMEHGMFVRLPIVATDPNSGVTYGVMPIWVVQEKHSDRIHSIHAPSLTYNNIFGVTPTYRYYRYPTDKSDIQVRASWSVKSEREAYYSMEDQDFLGKGWAFDGELHYNVDGSGRFFGIGPDSSKSAQTNFEQSTFDYSWRVGVPIFRGSKVKYNIAHHLAGQKIADGPIASLPGIDQRFPEQTPRHWHQDGELQLFMDYDTRDDAVTTRRGTYAQALLENSQHAWGSEFTFQRYQVDLRAFRPTGTSGRFASAGRVLYENLVGSAPFYLMPSLGGKYVHRGYGDGRYIDNSLLTGSYEERITVYKVPLAGVVTEIEVDPYFELGTVASSPHRFAARYARPVVGAAVRAIARPQVVGSIDMGVGEEGAAVFMDINYSY